MSEGIVYQCTYCGYEWLPKPKTKQYGWIMVGSDTDKCPKCSDTKIEKKRYEKIDYYKKGESGKRLMQTNV